MPRLARLTPLFLLVLVSPLSAQGRGGVELGIDLELTYSTDDPNVTVISIPSGSLRAGFAVNPRISLEPRISYQYARASGNSISLLEFQLGLLWHFTADPTRTAAYLRPFFGHVHQGGSFGGGDASSLGAGIGVKFPQGDRMALRLEGGYQHSLDDDASSQLFALFGISFFTR